MIHSDHVIHEWLSCDPYAVDCDVVLYKACMSQSMHVMLCWCWYW